MRVKLSDYMYAWLTRYKLNKIEPSSYVRLVSVFETCVKPYLGDVYIQDVTTSMIQDLIDEFSNPSGENIKPLARSGLKKIKNLLNPCFNHALKERLVPENPCKGVQIPVESCVKVHVKEQFALNDDELSRFKTACLKKLSYKNEYVSRNAIVLLILVNLGLRIGEMVALKWADIDFDLLIIRVNKIVQINLTPSTGLDLDRSMRVKKASKTKRGTRVIPFSDVVLSYLLELKAYDRRNKISSEFVACTLYGKMSRPQNFTRSLESVKRSAELNSAITLHTLRHTFGSYLLRSGTSVEVVSKLLGHSSITVTYNTYIHVLQEEAAKTMRKISIC